MAEFTPGHLNRWTRPDSYFGAEWQGYYVFLSQHRDSDTLTRSNFRSGLRAIGGESETVIVARERHWAVGWIEWIAIHESDTRALEAADAIKGSLNDYPVVNEDDWSALESEEADTVWRECYSPKERISYIRENRDQFEFTDFADLMGCVRGRYFAGYASELLY